MKKWFVLVALLLFVGFAPQMEAQSLQETHPRPLEQYTVQQGDTLWSLAGEHLNSPLGWEQLYQSNPFLREPGRRWITEDGKVVVLLKPGEVLNGLNVLGFRETPRPDLLSTLKGETKIVEMLPEWAWILFVALVLLIILLVMLANWQYNRYHKTRDRLRDDISSLEAMTADRDEALRLYADPVNSGPPMVPGGVNLETAPQHFQNMGVREWASATGGRIVEPDRIQILSIIPGHAWGRLSVRYRNGTLPEERVLTGQRVFRGQVRMPDGTEETLYMLQGCGNDVRFSGNRNVPGADFRFVPDSEQVPAPRVETPAPPTPVATATVATSNRNETGTVPVTPLVDRVEQLGHEVKQMLETEINTDLRFVFKRRRTDGRPMLIEVNGIDTNETEFTVNVTESSVSLRYMN
ncbi:MAG: LysM peptidoglycan-binding domain-containing protein [Patescibacteria group bacterium]